MKKILLFFVALLPLIQTWAQPDDSEWADPKPGDQQAWNAQKGITLSVVLQELLKILQIPLTTVSK